MDSDESQSSTRTDLDETALALAETVEPENPSADNVQALNPPEVESVAESDGSRSDEKIVGRTLKKTVDLTEDELAQINTKKGLLQLLSRKHIDVQKALETLRYERELEKLQIELVKLQRSVQLEERRVGIIVEGRDAAGKGGTIRRFIEHLNPRSARVVALPKPTEVEKGQWYFQRYTEQLPNPGEIVFFDRSWYNRAVVEPVMDFCTPAQYKTFMQQVPEFEHMLYEDNIEMVKFWFSISKEVQAERFQSRRVNPLKQWKISPVDEEAQKHWGTVHEVQGRDVQPHAYLLRAMDHRESQQQEEGAAGEYALRAVHPGLQWERFTAARDCRLIRTLWCATTDPTRASTDRNRSPVAS